jgi:glycosyltransferase involved in cell wall biosynthesis
LRSSHYHSLLDLTLVSSEHLRRWMIDHGADGEKIRVCYTNIDAEKWKPQPETRARERAALGVFDDETTVLLYPCRIAIQKRPELLCNIVAALRQATTARFLLVVAGTGSLLPALRTFVEQHDLATHVLVLGAMPLERIARLHDAADILLLPSLCEGIALALFEAMAMESVPVVSDVGGQRELVTEDCGHLIPLGEPVAEIRNYVSILKRLIEDPARRRRLAAAARARVEAKFPLADLTARFLAGFAEADAHRIARPVVLPDPALTRDVAAMAMDQLRSRRNTQKAATYQRGLEEQIVRRDKTIAKLQRQIDALRAQAHHAEIYAAV